MKTSAVAAQRRVTIHIDVVRERGAIPCGVADDQRAGLHRRIAGIGVAVVEHKRAAALLDQRAARAVDHARESGVVRRTECQRLGTERNETDTGQITNGRADCGEAGDVKIAVRIDGYRTRGRQCTSAGKLQRIAGAAPADRAVDRGAAGIGIDAGECDGTTPIALNDYFAAGAAGDAAVGDGASEGRNSVPTEGEGLVTEKDGAGAVKKYGAGANAALRYIQGGAALHRDARVAERARARQGQRSHIDLRAAVIGIVGVGESERPVARLVEGANVGKHRGNHTTQGQVETVGIEDRGIAKQNIARDGERRTRL